MNKWRNQSVSQSISQSINQSIKQSFSQTVIQSVIHLTKHVHDVSFNSGIELLWINDEWTDERIMQWMNEAMNKCSSQSINHSINDDVCTGEGEGWSPSAGGERGEWEGGGPDGRHGQDGEWLVHQHHTRVRTPVWTGRAWALGLLWAQEAIIWSECLTDRQNAWNNVRCSDNRQEIMLRHNTQRCVSQSEDWIFCVLRLRTLVMFDITCFPGSSDVISSILFIGLLSCFSYLSIY